MEIIGEVDANARGRERRNERYKQREFLNSFSTLPRLQVCGSQPAREGPVQLVVNEERSHYGNLKLCASVHACPVCAPKIRNERAQEIEAAVERWLAGGGGVQFVTVTLPHDYGDRLDNLLNVVRDGWAAVIRGGAWVLDRETYGIVGSIRALEMTHGANGWHPHLHFLVFTRRSLKRRERTALAGRLYSRWSAGVESHGVRTPSRKRGVDVREVKGRGIGEYISKVSMELARSDLKRARATGSRAPFTILAEAVQYGDVDDLALWWEYERATKGRRALFWSRGLKDRLGVNEVTDQEIADEDAAGGEEVPISQPLWSYIAHERGARLQLVQHAETHGVDGVIELLAKYEVAAFGEALPVCAGSNEALAVREDRRVERWLGFARKARDPGSGWSNATTMR